MLITLDQAVKRRTLQTSLKSVEKSLKQKGELFVVDAKNNPEFALVDFKRYGAIMDLLEAYQNMAAIVKSKNDKVYSEAEAEEYLGFSLK